MAATSVGIGLVDDLGEARPNVRGVVALVEVEDDLLQRRHALLAVVDQFAHG